MAQRGRPRVNLPEKILDEMAERDRRLEDAIVAPENAHILAVAREGWRLAAEADRLLRAIRNGAAAYVIRGTQQFREIKTFAETNGLVEAADACKFLQNFVLVWREPHDDYERQTNLARELAQDTRRSMATRSKHYTPDIPDAGLLLDLPWEFRQKSGKTYRVRRTVGPTLRELKLATALPERVIKEKIKSLGPRQGEITKQLRDKFARRGAMPDCFGPRLVRGVLDEFMKRLADFPISDDERKRCLEAATAVKRRLQKRNAWPRL